MLRRINRKFICVSEKSRKIRKIVLAKFSLNTLDTDTDIWWRMCANEIQALYNSFIS